jgi:putative ABC transport system permease protein
MLMVSLHSLEAIHLDWAGGAPLPNFKIAPERVRKFDLTPKTASAALVGLKSRASALQMARWVNDYKAEPLTAILPGVALMELWQLMAVADNALTAIAALVVLVSLGGLVALLVASLGERRRELAILRALGASPRHVFSLLCLEALWVTLAGMVLGVALLALLAAALAALLPALAGVSLSVAWVSAREWALLAAVLLASVVASILPAWRAYRHSVLDGMTIRS